MNGGNKPDILACISRDLALKQFGRRKFPLGFAHYSLLHCHNREGSIRGLKAQPGAADRMWIRSEPFRNPKPALLNRLKSPLKANIFSSFSSLQARIRGE
jgi:hypothetical protein